MLHSTTSLISKPFSHQVLSVVKFKKCVVVILSTYIWLEKR